MDKGGIKGGGNSSSQNVKFSFHVKQQNFNNPCSFENQLPMTNEQKWRKAKLYLKN